MSVDNPFEAIQQGFQDIQTGFYRGEQIRKSREESQMLEEDRKRQKAAADSLIPLIDQQKEIYRDPQAVKAFLQSGGDIAKLPSFMKQEFAPAERIKGQLIEDFQTGMKDWASMPNGDDRVKKGIELQTTASILGITAVTDEAGKEIAPMNLWSPSAKDAFDKVAQNAFQGAYGKETDAEGLKKFENGMPVLKKVLEDFQSSDSDKQDTIKRQLQQIPLMSPDDIKKAMKKGVMNVSRYDPSTGSYVTREAPISESIRNLLGVQGMAYIKDETALKNGLITPEYYNAVKINRAKDLEKLNDPGFWDKLFSGKIFGDNTAPDPNAQTNEMNPNTNPSLSSRLANGGKSNVDSTVAAQNLRNSATSSEAAPKKKELDVSPAKISQLIDDASEQQGIRPELFHALIGQESRKNPNTPDSPKGAQGLGQLMPKTAKELGVKNPHDPVENVHASARYFKQMLNKFGGDEKLALAAYNAGPGRVNKLIKKVGKASFAAIYKLLPAETQNYVTRISSRA